jgi:hypothetical protein
MAMIEMLHKRQQSSHIGRVGDEVDMGAYSSRRIARRSTVADLL